MTISRRVTIGHGAIIHARHRAGGQHRHGRGAQPLQRDRRGQRRGRVGARAAGGKIIPPETLVAGVPAKPLRELTNKDRTDWRETKDWYVRIAAQYLDPDNYHPVK